jgi:tetratricopeptide (TPR) repeat protein
LKPSTGDAYGQRANAYFKSGRYDEAIVDATKAISLNPTSTLLYHLRGNCHLESNSFDNAIADYSFAISNGKDHNYTGIYPAIENKQNCHLYFKRGKALYFTKQYLFAINDFSQAINLATQLKIQTDYMFYWRGRCNVELENYKEAVKDLEVSIQGFPQDVKMNHYLGLSYYKSGNTEKAKQYAMKLIDLDLSNEKYFSGDNMLSIFDMAKRRLAASQYFSQAREKINDFKNVTTSFFLEIKAAEAFQYLDSAWFMAPKLSDKDLRLRDSIVEAYFVVYPKLKEKPQIPENVRRYVVQATSATEEQNYDKSIGLWGNVLSIIPYNPMAYYNRALIWEFKGKYNLAIVEMKKYLRLAPDAEDARGAQDKIYLWESKATTQSIKTTNDPYPEITTKLRENATQSVGMYYFSLVLGGGIGFHYGDNTMLGNYWNSLGHTADENKYGGNFRMSYSGDAELLIRPVPRFGFGGFGKILGGIGTSTTVGSEKHDLNLASFQYGGMARAFLTLNDMGNTPDLYLQFKYGVNKVDGYYDKSVNGLVNYSHHISGSAPVFAVGFGFGGKVGKVSYITMDLEYFNSTVDVLNSKITVNDADPSTIGTTGKVPASANYSGLMIRFMLLGFCF